MGCTITKFQLTKKIPLQVRRKMNGKFKISDTQGSMILSIPSQSEENTSKPRPCLQIQIIPEKNKNLRFNLDLESTSMYNKSLEYIDCYKYIKEIYFNFSTVYRYFCNLVHDSCIENFRVTDGIMIMLISLAVNPDCKLSFCDSDHFFEVTGEIAKESLVIYHS